MPPLVLVAVAVAAVAIGAGIKAHGQIKQAKETKAAAEFNARQLEKEQTNVERERKENVRRQRIIGEKQKGKQRSLIAKAGVLENGSPLDLMAETSAELETRALDINRQSESTSRKLGEKAFLTRLEAKQQARGLKVAAAGTSVAAVGQIASAAGG